MSVSIEEVIATLKYRQIEISKTIMMLEAFFPEEEPKEQQREEKSVFATKDRGDMTIKDMILYAMIAGSRYSSRDVAMEIRRIFGVNVLKQSVMADLSNLLKQKKVTRPDKGVYVKKAGR